MKSQINDQARKVIRVKKLVLALMCIASFGLIANSAQAFSLFGSSNNAVVTSVASNSLEQQIRLAKTLAAQNKQLRPQVVQLALQAYTNAIRQGVEVKKPIITIIDYSLDSATKRMWVLDLVRQRVLFNSLVAHGKYSGDFKNSTSFSDGVGSLQTSLGLFVTGSTYEGHDGYSMVMRGLENGFNANAEVRHIVMHGAWYVNEQLAKSRGAVGKSWGCPALELRLTAPIINTIKDGSLVFSYYPSTEWLRKSRFVRANVMV